jgi:Asp-tRNA(Asn)/Glu-tRNA(Gln) amidotransferase A subunit family amidase
MNTRAKSNPDRADHAAHMDLVAQAGMLAAGQLSAVELLERSLDRIAATQDTLNAFRTVRTAAARAEAGVADERLRRGERLALLGVPIAVKDDVDAAAVAAGIVPAAVGSDGAGSVRIPASWCQLVGVKPQRGRISTWPDRESFNGLTCIGPLTRTVSDTALMLDVLSGNHPQDLHAPAPPDEPYAEAILHPPEALRIAVSLRPPYRRLSRSS